MDPESHYIELLKIFTRASEAIAGHPTEGDDRLIRAEHLAVKFIYHAISVLYLSRSTKLPEIGAGFIDPASIAVITRAGLESVLTFSYVYTSPSSTAEQDLRYHAWVLADLLCRQRFQPFSEEGRFKLAQEETEIRELRTKLQANMSFTSLPPKQQDKLMHGQWRLKGWTAIGLEMGLDKNHADSFYRLLCSYAHSGFLSVMQIGQATTAVDQKELTEASLGVLMIAMAHMIRLYCKVFSRSQAALQQDINAERLVQMWIDIGAKTSCRASIP